MKCIILCAGYATRLYPLTENFPKPLLEVKHKSIVNHLIDDLEQEHKIDQYIIVSNHKFVNYFNGWKKTRKEDIVVLDDMSTSNENRIGAVRDIYFAIKSLNINDDVLILAGDNILDFSLNEFINYYEKINKNCVMAYIENNIKTLQRCGVSELDENNNIISMEEKPQNPKSNVVTPTFYIFKKEDLHLLEKALNEGCGVDAPGNFLEWFTKQTTVNAFIMPGKRIDIGTLEDYNKYKD